MNFYQLSNTNLFLYSPINWLHLISQKHKILYVFFKLFFLPYANFNYLVIIFIITLLFLTSINLPIRTRDNLILTTIFFFFILIINAYYTTKNINANAITSNFYKIQPFRFFFYLIDIKTKNIHRIAKISFYISIAASRLIIISLTYIFTIKLFLLTTNYETVNLFLLKSYNYNIYNKNSQIPLIIILSSQFLKITLNNMTRLKIAFLIRSIKNNNKNHFRKSLWIYFYLIKIFFIDFYINIVYIAQTLHSRDILNRELNIINIYKQ